MPQTYSVGARSRFVTFTAWMFILLTVCFCASGLIQNATQAAWTPALPGDAAPLPWLTGLMRRYLPAVISSGLALSIATLVCAIGLLRRVEWARRVFIGLLGVAIAVNLAGLWLQQEYMQMLVSSALRQAALPQQAADVFGGFVTAARVMAVLVTLGTCGVFGWVIQRLMSASVRQEFV